ncbi:unnamed protein product [marine sediment metagenome]|uniref:Uncharacterized protein n=1 Tax=marine sediment metagenome TaxID=412755 RepID=X0YQT9_9ZZZZ
MHSIEYRPFIETFERLVQGESMDLYSVGFSQALEDVATRLFAGVRPYNWYDGVSGLRTRKRKNLQIEITGDMWVGDVGNSKQWLEPLRARVTDRSVSNEGVWVQMTIGEHSTESRYD